MNRKNKPKSSDFIDRMVAQFSIKESLELKRDITTFTNYWMARVFFIWCVVIGAWALGFHFWGVFASWGWCDPVEASDYLMPFMLCYMAVLPAIAWMLAYTAICQRLYHHVKVLAGVEDVDN